MAMAPTKAKVTKSTQSKDPNDGGDKDTVSRKEFDELSGMLKQTVQGMQGLSQVVTGLSESVSKGFTNLQNIAPQAPSAPPKESEPVDLEALNNKDLANFIIQNISSVVEDKIKENLNPISEEIQQTKQATTANDLKVQWNELTSKNKDAVYLANEIKEQANKNPNLPLADLYTLAKANNPEKVEQIAEQLKSNDDELKAKEQAQQGDPNKPRYGGMLPQGSPDLADDFKSDLSPNEAAEQAWADLGLDENLAPTL